MHLSCDSHEFGSLHCVCCTHGQPLPVARVKWEQLLGFRVCGRMRAESKEADGEALLTSQHAKCSVCHRKVNKRLYSGLY